MKGLTEKQQSILDFIESFSRTQGMSPTVYEIADHFGIQTATAFTHLRALQRKGYIDRSSKARSLTLMKSTASKHLSLTLSIPLLGRISAGAPLLAEQNVESSIQFDPKLLPSGTGGHRLFALRVHGQSMRDKGILDGDIVLAKEHSSAQIGEIAVCLVDDEATVKSFHITDDQVELRPANPDFKPQYYDYDEVRIQGIVVAAVRTF